ncbi:MAG: ABC transporter ATP-binding protein [Lachnospiraceae bacterium]|nr:ABC transporter ATP-binding protein [Lachnospiraceae bacterium]
MLIVKGITKQYAGSVVPAVDHFSFAFPDSGFFFILGKSGSGKTTLLNMLGGLEHTSVGEISFDNYNLSDMSPGELDHYRNLNVGFIFQENNLLPDLTVSQNLAIALALQETGTKLTEMNTRQISDVLRQVDLPGYEDRPIAELSGGEKQRVAIARALIKDPSVIFADEPTGDLDPASGRAVFTLLKALSRSRLVIAVTHDVDAAGTFADGVITLSEGKTVSASAAKGCDRFASYRLSVTTTADSRPAVTEYSEPSGLLEALSELLYSKVSDVTISIQAPVVKTAPPGDPGSAAAISEPASVTQTSGLSAPMKTTRRLSLSDSLFFAGKFAQRRLFHLILTVLLLSLSFLLLTITLFFSAYEEGLVLSAYFNRYRPSVLPPALPVSYENGLMDTVSHDLQSGPVFAAAIDRAAGSEKRIGLKKGVLLTTDPALSGVRFFPDTTVYFLSAENDPPFPLKEGSLPKTDSEICLTDYLAKQLAVSPGDTVLYDRFPMTVAGILATDYLEYSLEDKLQSHSSMYTLYYFSYRYNVAVTTDAFRLRHLAALETLRLPYSNFLLSSYETRYFSSAGTLSFGGLKDPSSVALVAGKLPSGPSEILVSRQFAQQNQIPISEPAFSERSLRYDFLNSHADRYGSCYSDAVDLSAVFPGGIVIAGVYESASTDPDVLISPGSWEVLLRLYGTDHYYDGYAVDCSSLSRYDSFVRSALAQSLQFEEPAARQIASFRLILREVSPVLTVLAVLVSLLAAALLVYYISLSIKKNLRSVGILRALGASSRDVSQIFLCITLLVYALSLLLGLLSAAGFVLFINRLYQSRLTENLYSILPWNHRLFALQLLATLALTILASVIPLRFLSRMSPAEIIRQS